MVSYSNAAKRELLGVQDAALIEHGAVSGKVAAQMADGARRLSGVEVALSVTGIAGPDGGTDDKPVGTVWFGWSLAGHETVTEARYFDGDREAIRRQSVAHALKRLNDLIDA